MLTCRLDVAGHVHVRLHCFILTEACSCRLELAYFVEKISKNRLVCKNAVALTYYGSCRLQVMSYCDQMIAAFERDIVGGMLGIENPTCAVFGRNIVARTWPNDYWHHATSTNVAWKIWTLSNLSQRHPTSRNMSQHVTTGCSNAPKMLLPRMLRYTALKWRYAASKLWNAIPDESQKIQTCATFKLF